MLLVNKSHTPLLPQNNLYVSIIHQLGLNSSMVKASNQPSGSHGSYPNVLWSWETSFEGLNLMNNCNWYVTIPSLYTVWFYIITMVLWTYSYMYYAENAHSQIQFVNPAWTKTTMVFLTWMVVIGVFRWKSIIGCWQTYTERENGQEDESERPCYSE